MKKIIMILLVLCSIMTGCTNNEKVINLVQIKELFEKHGVPLAEQVDLNKNNVFQMILNGVEPESYIVNDKQKISIYVYASSEEVKEGIKDFKNNTATASVISHRRYQVANVLMFYISEGLGYPEDERIEMVLKDMNSLVE
ncbi:hypothetical protein D3P07_02345 [Paenibacillus sp. 1011MAR3C5]|uniref:hypothetical protein n=1 Tax=Paenibacillus sp. 1011MAR3C5 TaxID=1675787 RepID=UPI000E6CBD56|nr:hypothetical protein [Paenibacillus sp. 1011MAR3C5]RJE90943.1 hypothetical protein D3P07_02345 [Paenibacillus sp. 1011MAR3C5]